MFLEFVGTVRAASLVAVHSTLALDARNMLLCSQMLYSMAKAWSEPCVWTCLARAEHPVRYVTGLGIAGFVFLCFGIGLLTAYGLHRSLLQCSKPWDTATTGSIRQVLHAFASRSRRLFWKLWIMRGVWESWVMSHESDDSWWFTTYNCSWTIGHRLRFCLANTLCNGSTWFDLLVHILEYHRWNHGGGLWRVPWQFLFDSWATTTWPKQK